MASGIAPPRRRLRSDAGAGRIVGIADRARVLAGDSGSLQEAAAFLRRGHLPEKRVGIGQWSDQAGASGRGWKVEDDLPPLPVRSAAKPEKGIDLVRRRVDLVPVEMRHELRS